MIQQLDETRLIGEKAEKVADGACAIPAFQRIVDPHDTVVGTPPASAAHPIDGGPGTVSSLLEAVRLV